MSRAEPGGKTDAPTERAPSVIVAAAVLIEAGRVLLTQRKAGTHLAGAWEFPGGKVHPGEDPRDALARELREEVGIDADVGAPLEVSFHAYPEKDVLLLFFEVKRLPSSPDPEPLDVADLRWAKAHELVDEDFPPADLDVLRIVRTRLGVGASLYASHTHD